MRKTINKTMLLEEEVLGLRSDRRKKAAMTRVNRYIEKNNIDRAVKMVTRLFDEYEVEQTYCIKYGETFRAINYKMTVTGKGGEIGLLLEITKIEPLFPAE